MASYVIQERTLTNIANAIRSKTDITDTLSPAEMVDAIIGISTHSNGEIDGLIMRTSEVIESNSASYVADYAFYKNPSIRVVVLPNSYIVGEYAFANCINLEHVSTGARQINRFAFYNCDELIEVLFDPDINLIGVSAFDGCTSLKEINLKNTQVRTISASAFANSGIEELWLPENAFCSLASPNAFSGCPIGVDGDGGLIHVPMSYRVSYEANGMWSSVFRNDKNRVVSY